MKILVSTFRALIDVDGVINFDCKFYFEGDMQTLRSVSGTKNDMIEGEPLQQCLQRLYFS